MLDDASAAYLAAILAGDADEEQRLARVLDAATTLERQHRDNPHRTTRAAYTYADAGIAVFPAEPRGKRPLTPHGFKDATTDHATIDAWWRQWPDANLAVPTGELFDVIDVDGRDGVLAMFCGPYPLIDTVTVLGRASTSRDGGHHVYVPPSGHSNKTAIHPGVDYRGRGGYVIAPPSIGANGRRYEWRTPLELPGTSAAA